MSNEIEIKMLEDENGEFYTKTHISAVDGMEEHIDDLTKLINILSQFVKSPQWETYSVIGTVEKDFMYGASGFHCGVRKIQIGSNDIGNNNTLTIKTVRVNIRNFKNQQKIAQLPTEFMNNTQVFWARGGDNHEPIMVELNKNGDIIPKLSENDKNKEPSANWIYAQFTWIE